MKIGIHRRNGSFSDRWIIYCEENKIPFKIVNCYDNDIIKQLDDCDALMWHLHHTDYKDALFAKGLLSSLKQSGKKIFPDFNTVWHFDDKVGQKYLLESINAPMVPSYVFYDKRKALDWVRNTQFPKVFKLRGGSGSRNVLLANNKREAVKLIRKAFNRGFAQSDRIGQLKERIRKVKEKREPLSFFLKGLGRLIIPNEFSRMHSREKGYAYFQDFIENNTFDIRVIVVSNHAFAIKRMIRQNDFRASGSGDIIYDIGAIDKECIRIAFETNEKLKTQSIAYDFVFDDNGCPLIVEISYGYAIEAYDHCPGYWDKELNWHPGKFNPQAWMVESLVLSLKEN